MLNNTTFGYIDRILIVLSATSSGVSIISFTSTSWNSKCKSYFNFFFNNWNSYKINEYNKKKKKKHDKIRMLAKSKLNSIHKLISQALIDIDISHEEFIIILKEKDIYEMIKDNFKNKNGE